MMGQDLTCIALPDWFDHSHLHFDGCWHFYIAREAGTVCAKSSRQKYLLHVFTLSDSSFVDVFYAVTSSY